MEKIIFQYFKTKTKTKALYEGGTRPISFHIVAVATFMDSLTEYFQSHELRSEIQLTGNYARDNFDRL